MSPYCPACAEEAGPEGGCPRCGLPLTGAESLVGHALYDTVVVAEDSQLIGGILKEGLTSEGLASRVMVATDGREFLARCADYLYSDFPLDLAIIDLEMPVLGGEATAIALRAFEEGCRARKVPIIFFTSRQIDDRLRGLIRVLKPAHYLNKGQDAAPDRIVRRLRQIMRALQM